MTARASRRRRRLAAFLVMAGLALPAPARSEPDAGATRLWRAEERRIGEMLRLAAAPGPPPRAPRPLDPSPAPVPLGEGRRVTVSTAAELAAALAHARPGDAIRLADGIYSGRFVAQVPGTAAAPITLWGSRAAVLDGGTLGSGYGFHLRADHWRLVGFTVRRALKGIIADGARHNLLLELEVHDTGEEAIHLRAGSSDNRIERCWIHDAGSRTPRFGEGVYLGSARSNWPGGRPDPSDRNRVAGNLIGPGVRAEAVDAKEGTREGEIVGNVFLGAGATHADSWVDLKGNDYRVRGNRGSFDPLGRFRRAVAVHALAPGWGIGNRAGEQIARPADPGDREPFRAASSGGATSVVLARRALPYTLAELRARFPGSFADLGDGAVLAREPIVVAPGASLVLDAEEAAELRLRSDPAGFASLVSHGDSMALRGARDRPLVVRSWDAARGVPDARHEDGRAYLAARAGRMDVVRIAASHLGFGTGWCSGVAWRGTPARRVRGTARDCRFERNYFGVYTFEAEAMHWEGNVFAHNHGYGFDPHDHSDRFVVVGNAAYGNGSHGMILSRGCSGNVLRRNRSHDNGGHGIMIDDGKVLDDGNPRHRRPVPSNDNVLEGNEVWGNDAGIAFQGGTRNHVRGNVVRDNRYGIRAADGARGNRFEDNTILDSRVFGLFLDARSDRNRVAGNRIRGGKSGIVVRDSRGSRIEGNSVSGIVGRGIVLLGDVQGSVVAHNAVVGRGARAIDATRAQGLEHERLAAANRTHRWMPTRSTMPSLLLWTAIVGVPLASRLSPRRTRASR